MKLTKTALSLSLLAIMATSGMANAENSQFTVKVQGSIVPAACDIGNGSKHNELDLGKLTVDQLNVNDDTLLPNRTLTLSIQCAGATAVGIQPTDVAEKAGQVTMLGAPAPNAFSLGVTDDGTVIGGYLVKMSSFGSTVDGKNVSTFISSAAGTELWHNVDMSKPISGTGKDVYSWATGSNGLTPAMGTAHTIKLEISPFINPTSKLKTTENIDIKGEATYDLVYL